MQLPVQASDYYENVMTYTTENKNEQKLMDKEIQKNGKKYELKGISYEIVEETPEIEKKEGDVRTAIRSNSKRNNL